MRTTWNRWLLVAALCTLLAPCATAKDEAPPSPFADAKQLEKHLGPACDMVEAICGAKFTKRPTVHVSDAKTIARLMEVDLATLPEEVLSKADRPAAARVMARYALAKYDSEGHGIHVNPDAVKAVTEAQEGATPLGVDHLRLLLVHEAAHALDFMRFDLAAVRRARKTTDGRQALNAVLEGHAQWVTEKAAGRWKLESAFARLTDAILGREKDLEKLDNPIARAAVGQMGFAYAQGHAFFRALEKAKGTAGVEAAMRKPPTRTREIEHPDEYLNPPQAEAVDLATLIEGFRPLVAHEAWTVRSQRVLEAVIRTQAARVPEERRKEFLQGYVDAHVLVGTVQDEDLQVVAMVFQFDTVENARLFAELERLVVEAAKGNPPALTFETKALGDGVGTDGKQRGFHMHRVVKTPAMEVPVHQQVLTEGVFTCEVMAVNVPGMDRAAMDPVVDYVAALLRDPKAAATLKKPAPFPFKRTKRMVTVQVVDPEGNIVPMARVSVMTRRGTMTTHDTERCPAGACKLSIGKDPVTVRATRAQSVDDEPLNYAPSEAVQIKEDTEHVELRMRPGLAIRGRVLDVAGKPAAGVHVAARSMRFDPIWGGPDADFSATSRDDGTFEIVGLPKGTYRLIVSTEPGPFAEGQEFPDHDAGAQDVELRLKKLNAIRLTVVGPDDKPVVGARVSARARGASRARGGMTDEQGVVRVRGIEPGVRYELEIDVDRVQGRDDVSHYKRRNWDPADERIQLAPGWTLHGMVVNDDGEPVAAKFFHKTSVGSWTAFPTGPGGSFRVRGLSGPVEVAARPADTEHDPTLHESLQWTTIQPTKERVELEMAKLDESKFLRVRVLDGNGKPVPAITMRISTGDLADPFDTTTTSSSARNGLFRIQRPGKRFHAEVFNARTLEGAALPLGPTLRMDIDPGVGELEFRLPKGRVLTGTVTAADGKPLGGVEVLALPPKTHAWNRGHFDAYGVAKTKEDGSFELISLGPQPYVLRAIPPEPHVEPGLVHVGAKDTTADIRLVGSIEVVIRDWRDEPVQGAQVTVQRVTALDSSKLSEDVFSGTTNAEGKVSMRSFASATKHRLVVRPPEARNDLLRHVVRDWDGTAGTVALPRGYVIAGVVRDAKGSVAKAGIVVRRAEGRWGVVARADGQGRFTTPPVPWGPVEVRAEGNTHDRHADRPQTQIARVTPEQPQVTLTMKPRTAELRLRLKEARKGWSGWVVRKGAGRTAFEFEADGATTVKGLAKGTYSIYIPRPDDEKRCVYVTGVEASKGETTLELVQTLSFAFRIEAPRGAAELMAHVVGPAFERFGATKNAEGLWVAKGLPPGTWTAVAYAKVGPAWFEGSAETDGSKPVTLELEGLDDR